MSDKVVNVYVGECFQDGSQTGGEGKSYGLSLTGNKLKLVENGQQSEVDLPAGGGANNHDIEAFNTLMFMLAKAQYNPDHIYSSPAGEYTVTISGKGTPDDPYYVNFVYINSDLVGNNLPIGDVYNHKGELLINSEVFKDFQSYPYSLFYGDTPVPYDDSTKTFGVPKLPKGIRAYRIIAK